MNGLTWIHIAGGSAALLAGAVALSLRKGGRLHAKVGTWFFIAMLVLASTGALIAALKPERGSAVGGVFTCYLVATAWMAARRRDGRPGRFELFALPVALGIAISMFAFGVQAANSPSGTLDSLPAGPHFGFAVVAALAAALDLNFIVRGQLTGVQRTARHLWRMCAALFIASGSFFLGQQDEFPEALQGMAIWFVLALAPLAAMVFWIARVRFSKAFRWVPPRRIAGPPGGEPALTAAE